MTFDYCRQCGKELSEEDSNSYPLELKRSAMRVPSKWVGDYMTLCENCIKEICQLFQAWLENDSSLRLAMGWETEGHERRTISELLDQWKEWHEKYFPQEKGV